MLSISGTQLKVFNISGATRNYKHSDTKCCTNKK